MTLGGTKVPHSRFKEQVRFAMSVCSCLGDTTETLKWNGLLGMKNVSADVAKVSLKWCFPPILISKILRVHL